MQIEISPNFFIRVEFTNRLFCLIGHVQFHPKDDVFWTELASSQIDRSQRLAIILRHRNWQEF